MIPIIFKLRESVRFEDRGDHSLIISEVPLNVVRASKRAEQILKLCDGIRTLPEIADEAGIVDDTKVFKICDYFNKKAVLEIFVAGNLGYFPSITVVIPTRDRGESLVECLESLYSQDYPSDRIEVIVINDGSLDETPKLASTFSCKLHTNPLSRGQAYCRNLGAQHAQGEILAFLDDDCVAGRTWLRDLVPYFQWDEVAAVGGYVDGYKTSSLLDRYEMEFSLLNLGKHMLRGEEDLSTFYIPTCNMLVRKKVFDETGGIRESLHLGEDVDFCWRMRDAAWKALYVPSGTVMHKHRNTLGKMLRRRADYGTSEAVLSSLHPHRMKSLQMRPLAAAAFLGFIFFIVSLNLIPLLATGAAFVAETAAKAISLHRKCIRISFGRISSSVLRMYMSYFYAMSFHLVRYYLVLLFLMGIVLHSLWILAFCLLIYTASVDYASKRPQLIFPVFLFYYFLDHLAYQLGVMAGCLRERSFRSYLVRHTRRRVSLP